MKTEEEVKPGESSDSVTDNKNVPWENRAKEYERKLAASEKRYSELEARMNAVEDVETKPAPAEQVPEELNKRELAEFVGDPSGWFDRRLEARQFKAELPAAQSWLRSQEGFSSDDENRVVDIIREYGLDQPSPMARAKAAYSILRSEKLEKEFSNGKRKTEASKTMLDGSGKESAKSEYPKRADLLKKLAVSELKGDSQTSALIMDQLSDVRT